MACLARFNCLLLYFPMASLLLDPATKDVPMRLIQPDGFSLTDQTPDSVIFTGSRGEQFQISVLDDDLIRVRHLPDGAARLDRTWLVVGPDGDMPREGRLRDDLSPFPLPGYTLDKVGNVFVLKTQTLQLDIDAQMPWLRWSTADGLPFAADLRKRAYTYDQAGNSVYHYLERRRDEHYFGFGERSGVLDKRGMRFRMVNVDALGYNAETSDPLYKHIPFYITFIPSLNLAYGLFYDNTSTVTFDMGKEIDGFWGDYRFYHAEDGDLDYTLIYGPTIDAVVTRFVALTGKPVLPPRWSLGYLGSTMQYTDAPNAQEMLARFVQDCERYDIPCDLFHLSSGYTLGADGNRYIFTWNRSRVPEPTQMTETFHNAGIHLAANIKPHLLTTHPAYHEVAQAGGFIKDSEQDAPAPGMFWSGGAGESGAGAYVDFTSEAGYRWWQAQATAQLLDYGIDVLWNDNNEFEIWDDDARCDGFGSPIPLGQARPLQTLLMGRASYEATQQHQSNRRAFILTRSACAGLQRYAQTWSGDNDTSWHTLRYNIPMGLGLSLSGMPNTGHDVGGFHGPAPDPELFVRWVQNGILHPRFTIHSWNSDGSATAPWMYPDVLPIIREAIQFRYRLIPYLYTLLFEAAQTGRPIIRPLVYHFPNDPRCHTESFDFLLGPNVLVASVLEPGARTRSVYLPAGVGIDWTDFHTGQRYAGGQTVIVDAPLDRIPLFVPVGGIIPMGRAMRFIGEQPDDLRQAYVFPHAGEGRATFTLIEDDGVSLDYRRGIYTSITLEVIATPDSLTLTIQLSGGYPLPYPEIEFILPPGETRPIQAAGLHNQWTADDGRQHVHISVF